MSPTKEFVKRCDALTNVIDTLSNILQENRAELNKFVYMELKRLGYSDHVVSMYHECGSSPVMMCVYEKSDVCRDSCVFCEYPEERK